MPRVLFSADARWDLYQIWKYIREQSDSADTANRVLDEIEDRCQTYAARPLLGEARPDFAPDVRCFPVYNYIVFYLPMPDGIEVILVVHGSRDLPRVFRERLGQL
jgi:toxin ParE1/3/4